MTTEKSILLAGPMGAGFCGYLIDGDQGVTHAHGPDLASVIAELQAEGVSILSVGGDVAETVPIPVIPHRTDVFPGLSQTKPEDDADAWVRMSAMGFLTGNADWDGVLVIISGGRSHWLHISADEVVSFQSSLTPHLVSVLGGAAGYDLDLISEILSRPERLAFALSRGQRMGDGAYITAALLGAELAAMRPYWLGQKLAIITPDDAPDYATALMAQGCAVETMPLSDALQAAMGVIGAQLG